MKKIVRIIALTIPVIVVALLIAKPVFSAVGDPPSRSTVEYKVLTNMGRRSTISKMEKALDSFVEQQKEKAILEIDLKKMGDEGWELVYYERDSGFAIFKRPVQEKK